MLHRERRTGPPSAASALRQLAGALAILLCLAAVGEAATKREIAAARYRSAARLYDDLQQVPRLELGRQQYDLVISAFQAVLRADPTSGYCDDALLHIAKLYGALGERYERDKDRSQELSTYRFLAREYPSSKHKAAAAAFIARLGLGGSVQPTSPPQTEPEAAQPLGLDASAIAISDQHQPEEVVGPPKHLRASGRLSRIRALRHHSYDLGTRVVLELDGVSPLLYEVLQNPDRLYIDIHNSRLSSALTRGVQVPIGDELLHAARLGQNRRSTARIVLDLKQKVAFDAFWLGDPVRLVIDVRPNGAARPPRTLYAIRGDTERPPPGTETGSGRAVPKPAEATTVGRLSLTRALGLKPRRVLIDPGHGGHDTGSIGRGGLREKDVVLDVSTRLGALLESSLGAEVLYTRLTDKFVPLEERSLQATKLRADLMISIHCNSARSSRVRGVETYYLDITDDPWSLSVAAAENAATSRSVGELGGLLAKIARREKTDESRELASKVQASLFAGLAKHSSSIRNRGVRSAPFVVLVEAEMPAILTEIGFLSNPSDEALLRQPSFRQEVARHLLAGIRDYAESLGMTLAPQPISADSTHD